MVIHSSTMLLFPIHPPFSFLFTFLIFVHNFNIINSISLVSCLCLKFITQHNKREISKQTMQNFSRVTLCYAQWIAFRVHLHAMRYKRGKIVNCSSFVLVYDGKNCMIFFLLHISLILLEFSILLLLCVLLLFSPS